MPWLFIAVALWCFPDKTSCLLRRIHNGVVRKLLHNRYISLSFELKYPQTFIMLIARPKCIPPLYAATTSRFYLHCNFHWRNACQIVMATARTWWQEFFCRATKLRNAPSVIVVESLPKRFSTRELPRFHFSSIADMLKDISVLRYLIGRYLSHVTKVVDLTSA